MRVQAQVSLYPLKTTKLAEAIEQFCRVLRRPHLSVEMQSMSTWIVGDSAAVIQAVEQAFRAVSTDYSVVMDLKVSNACPHAVDAGTREVADDPR
jgi:uncharacterized protein YqgV (UPF0045/DUF77 family)